LENITAKIYIGGPMKMVKKKKWVPSTDSLLMWISIMYHDQYHEKVNKHMRSRKVFGDQGSDMNKNLGSKIKFLGNKQDHK